MVNNVMVNVFIYYEVKSGAIIFHFHNKLVYTHIHFLNDNTTLKERFLMFRTKYEAKVDLIT